MLEILLISNYPITFTLFPIPYSLLFPSTFRPTSRGFSKGPTIGVLGRLFRIRADLIVNLLCLVMVALVSPRRICRSHLLAYKRTGLGDTVAAS